MDPLIDDFNLQERSILSALAGLDIVSQRRITLYLYRTTDMKKAGNGPGAILHNKWRKTMKLPFISDEDVEIFEEVVQFIERYAKKAVVASIDNPEVPGGVKNISLFSVHTKLFGDNQEDLPEGTFKFLNMNLKVDSFLDETNKFGYPIYISFLRPAPSPDNPAMPSIVSLANILHVNATKKQKNEMFTIFLLWLSQDITKADKDIVNDLICTLRIDKE